MGYYGSRQTVSLPLYYIPKGCAPLKLSALATKTTPLLPLLCCPLCGQGFILRDQQSLVCEARHCFDLSTHGYINLAPQHNQETEKYNKALFDSRQRIFAGGFYTALVHKLNEIISNCFTSQQPFTLLDAGCGEGYYARQLTDHFPIATVLGMDISRAAIVAAAKQSRQPHWFVGNLGRLPLADHSINTILNLLTPADYSEFNRVLAPNGLLIKVIPGIRYLQEIRAAITSALRSTAYSNERVVTHLSSHMRIVGQHTLEQTFPVSKEEASCFFRMTPMTFSLAEDSLSEIALSHITIHLEVLVCEVL